MQPISLLLCKGEQCLHDAESMDASSVKLLLLLLECNHSSLFMEAVYTEVQQALSRVI